EIRRYGRHTDLRCQQPPCDRLVDMCWRVRPSQAVCPGADLAGKILSSGESSAERRQGVMGCGSEEEDMTGAAPALDEAVGRMAAASFELPNGFVNHGAMACEALAMLDCADDIDSWARRFAAAGGALVDPAVPAGFDWRQALGDYHRLPEWIGYFTQAIDDDGWPAVVATWVPRLMPALRTALFHGAIRTAHAVRAIDAVDTPPRRGELARALGYSAARHP